MMDFHLRRGFLRWCAVIMMTVFIMFVIAVKAHEDVASSRTPSPLPRVGLCESSVIIHGYPCQEFYVKTEDGYVLSMQRIPGGRSSGGVGGGEVKNKQPVLLQHGVLVDGMIWLLNSPEQSLGFILADNGYDVWIANTRGTRFSRQHATLDATKREYWNWSWDELVEYDLPATVDFVYSQTGQKVHYVGHSLGTLIALASFSEGKLVDRVRSAGLLSPIAYLSHMNTTLGIIAAKAFVGEIATLIGVAEFNPKGEAVGTFLRSLCMIPGIDCYDLIASFTGKNCCLNASTVDLFLKNEPQSTSTKNMIHLAQTVRDGIVSKFDYGVQTLNVQRYGESKPPIYNLSNIPSNVPLYLTYGGRDALSDAIDVKLLLDKLKFHNRDEHTTLFIEDYAHADFVIGVNAKEIVYDSLITFFRLH